MLNETLHIDLTLPRGWNQCTVEQLETIATIIVGRTAIVDRYHPLDMYAIKVDIFFTLCGLEIVSQGYEKDDTPAEKQYYLCRKKGIKRPFPIYTWQVDSFVKSELKWIDDEHALGLTNFVYPSYSVWHGLHHITYDGPATLMQDFTWQRYRFAQDFMEWYVTASNHLMKMATRPREYTRKDLDEQRKVVTEAMAKFLATLYNRKITYTDPTTGRKARDYSFTPSQPSDNWQDFRNYDPIHWQVILLWWSGMMRYLKHKYKRCFKRQKTDSPHSTTPLDLYTRTVATMEKYLGLDEQTVNNQNFHIVLQHMEDIAASNEEMEKIRNKK